MNHELTGCLIVKKLLSAPLSRSGKAMLYKNTEFLKQMCVKYRRDGNYSTNMFLCTCTPLYASQVLDPTSCLLVFEPY